MLVRCRDPDDGDLAQVRLNEQLASLEIGIEFKLDLRCVLMAVTCEEDVKDWPPRPEDLEIINELGAGNGGTVSKARHIPTGAIMARKVRDISRASAALG